MNELIIFFEDDINLKKLRYIMELFDIKDNLKNLLDCNKKKYK